MFDAPASFNASLLPSGLPRYSDYISPGTFAAVMAAYDAKVKAKLTSISSVSSSIIPASTIEKEKSVITTTLPSLEAEEVGEIVPFSSVKASVLSSKTKVYSSVPVVIPIETKVAPVRSSVGTSTISQVSSQPGIKIITPLTSISSAPIGGTVIPAGGNSRSSVQVNFSRGSSRGVQSIQRL